MAVRSEPQVNEIEHRRRAGDLAESPRILRGCRFQVGRFDRHGVDLFRTQWRVSSRLSRRCVRFLSGSSRGRNSFVHLHHVNGIPGNIFSGQIAEHDPRGVAAADGHDKSAARCDRLRASAAMNRGGLLCDQVGIGIDLIVIMRTTLARWLETFFCSSGFSQPPGGVTLSTSSGPQVLGAY